MCVCVNLLPPESAVGLHDRQSNPPFEQPPMRSQHGAQLNQGYSEQAFSSTPRMPYVLDCYGSNVVT